MSFLNKLNKYKKNNHNSWLEFIMVFGIPINLEDGGFLLFIYGWGGIAATLIMKFMV